MMSYVTQAQLSNGALRGHHYGATQRAVIPRLQTPITLIAVSIFQNKPDYMDYAE